MHTPFFLSWGLMYFRFVQNIYQLLSNLKVSGKKALAVLLDPDKLTDEHRLNNVLSLIAHSNVDFVFVGGSLLVESNFHACIQRIKADCKKPVVIFPGSPSQVSKEADAILFLSLISGRNADLLIGQHVQAAPVLKEMNIEILPTGYMLIESGRSTTALYMSQTLPIPADKPEIAAATAIAGEMLGLKLFYMDGGSGAQYPVSAEMIDCVAQSISAPLIIGGGIRSEEDARRAWNSGAQVVVVGTAFEEEPELLFALCNARPSEV